MIFAEILKQHDAENITGYELSFACLHLPATLFSHSERFALSTMVNRMSTTDQMICTMSVDSIALDSSTSTGTVKRIFKTMHDNGMLFSHERRYGRESLTTVRVLTEPMVKTLVAIVAKGREVGFHTKELHDFAAGAINALVEDFHSVRSEVTNTPDPVIPTERDQADPVNITIPNPPVKKEQSNYPAVAGALKNWFGHCWNVVSMPVAAAIQIGKASRDKRIKAIQASRKKAAETKATRTAYMKGKSDNRNDGFNFGPVQESIPFGFRG